VKLKLGIIMILLVSLVGCNQPFTTNTATIRLSDYMKTRWMAQGVEPQDLNETLTKIKNSQSNQWTREWVNSAEKQVQLMNTALSKKELDNVYAPAFKAALYYRLAAFPAMDDKEKKAAYTFSQKYYEEAFKFSPKPPQKLSIPYEGREITGFVRYPEGASRPPLVIVVPGIESMKEDFLLELDKLTGSGLAVFVADLPGTANSPWKYRPDSIKMILAITQFFKNSSYVNGNHIGLLGFNFGGSLALRAAALNPEIKAVATVGAPINTAFSTAFWNRMPEYMQKMFLEFTGFGTSSELSKELPNYSLIQAENVKKLSCPVLLLSGKKDFLTTAEDQTLMAQNVTLPIQMKIYEDGEFGMWDLWSSELYPLVSSWLFEKLNK
jgi:dienelactone hydrolase